MVCLQTNLKPYRLRVRSGVKKLVFLGSRWNSATAMIWMEIRVSYSLSGDMWRVAIVSDQINLLYEPVSCSIKALGLGGGISPVVVSMVRVCMCGRGWGWGWELGCGYGCGCGCGCVDVDVVLVLLYFFITPQILSSVCLWVIFFCNFLSLPLLRLVYDPIGNKWDFIGTRSLPQQPGRRLWYV